MLLLVVTVVLAVVVVAAAVVLVVSVELHKLALAELQLQRVGETAFLIFCYFNLFSLSHLFVVHKVYVIEFETTVPVMYLFL